MPLRLRLWVDKLWLLILILFEHQVKRFNMEIKQTARPCFGTKWSTAVAWFPLWTFFFNFSFYLLSSFVCVFVNGLLYFQVWINYKMSVSWWNNVFTITLLAPLLLLKVGKYFKTFAYKIGPLRDLVTWHGINYAGTQLPKQRNSYQSNLTFLCFESPTV